MQADADGTGSKPHTLVVRAYLHDQMPEEAERVLLRARGVAGSGEHAQAGT